MKPSWVAMKWIKSFVAYGMGEPLIVTRSDLPDVNNQLGPTTTTPIAADLKSSQCVVGTITRVPVTQPSSAQQKNFSSSQLVAAKRTT